MLAGGIVRPFARHHCRVGTRRAVKLRHHRAVGSRLQQGIGIVAIVGTWSEGFRLASGGAFQQLAWGQASKKTLIAGARRLGGFGRLRLGGGNVVMRFRRRIERGGHDRFIGIGHGRRRSVGHDARQSCGAGVKTVFLLMLGNCDRGAYFRGSQIRRGCGFEFRRAGDGHGLRRDLRGLIGICFAGALRLDAANRRDQRCSFAALLALGGVLGGDILFDRRGDRRIVLVGFQNWRSHRRFGGRLWFRFGSLGLVARPFRRRRLAVDHR